MYLLNYSPTAWPTYNTSQLLNKYLSSKITTNPLHRTQFLNSGRNSVLINTPLEPSSSILPPYLTFEEAMIKMLINISTSQKNTQISDSHVWKPWEKQKLHKIKRNFPLPLRSPTEAGLLQPVAPKAKAVLTAMLPRKAITNFYRTPMKTNKNLTIPPPR